MLICGMCMSCDADARLLSLVAGTANALLDHQCLIAQDALQHHDLFTAAHSVAHEVTAACVMLNSSNLPDCIRAQGQYC